MSNSLLEDLFGCTHRKTTFPITPIRRCRIATRSITEKKAQTYVACLDCGKELPYDWERMCRVKNSLHARPLQTLRRAIVGFRLRSASKAPNLTSPFHGFQNET